ncbi:hypothetical protein GUJ93_ZPchr0013g37981 [Zizania palustris]|uniref:Uncharacterized protein n=1 Tax=Zizania palustris TaxID=103762 RepID=A0A8J5WUS6_ZIZPA|nr:hypothetical protein GUJ93_ZPchr0013g37981 [Zizania palustris]
MASSRLSIGRLVPRPWPRHAAHAPPPASAPQPRPRRVGTTPPRLPALVTPRLPSLQSVRGREGFRGGGGGVAGVRGGGVVRAWLRLERGQWRAAFGVPVGRWMTD